MGWSCLHAMSVLLDSCGWGPGRLSRLVVVIRICHARAVVRFVDRLLGVLMVDVPRVGEHPAVRCDITATLREAGAGHGLEVAHTGARVVKPISAAFMAQYWDTPEAAWVSVGATAREATPALSATIAAPASSSGLFMMGTSFALWRLVFGLVSDTFILHLGRKDIHDFSRHNPHSCPHSWSVTDG